MSGLDRIQQAFEQARAAGRAALMPYFTLGYPTPDDSVEVVAALAEAGADLIELGVPFSDPLADGPTIQHSTQVALEQGMSVARCLDLVRAIRARGVQQPLLLMGYINPVLAYGAEQYVRAANQAGADGLIIPDLPLEESASIEATCQANGLALVYLAAPTSTLDLSMPSAAEIPVEERAADEVRGLSLFGRPASWPEAPVANPAFDRTPARLVSAIVTEQGVHRAPYERSLRDAWDAAGH